MESLNYKKNLINKLRKDGYLIGYKGFDLFLFHYKKKNKIDDNLNIIIEVLTDKQKYLHFTKDLENFKLLHKNE